MERGGGAVEADVTGHALGSREMIEPGLVGRLADVAPRRELLQKVRIELAHGGRTGTFRTAKPLAVLPQECTGAKAVLRLHASKRRCLSAFSSCRAACRGSDRPPPSAPPCGLRRNGSRQARSRGRSRCPSAS